MLATIALSRCFVWCPDTVAKVRRTVAVVGGGVQGTLTALACAEAGWRVTLFERCPALWQGASANNEGKIHLGFTYGLDRSGATPARLAALGSTFEAALSALLGPLPPNLVVARHVHYALHEDSELDADATQVHLESTAALANRPGAVRRLADHERKEQFSERITDVWEVPETTIEPTVLGELVLEGLAQRPDIDVVTNVGVGELRDDGTVWDAAGHGLGRFDRLINCAWDGLAKLHGTGDGFCLRGKAGFIARVRSTGPVLPVTFCFGPFGDVVPLPDDRCYISWYPACLMGFTTDLSTGSDWYDRLAESFDFADAYRRSRLALADLIPDLTLDEHYQHRRAGPILAAGQSDIYDHHSRLHQRTAIGIDAKGRIAAINPGKLTTAPWWASEAARWLQDPRQP